MDQTKNGLERLYNAKKNLEYLLDKAEEKPLTDDERRMLADADKYKDEFEQAMDDDLNTADAVSSVFELAKFANSNLDEENSKEAVAYILNLYMKLSKVLGILTKEDEILEDQILELIEQRTSARKNRDFKKADEIRDHLKEKGIVLEDTSDGVKWKRI